MIALHRKTEVRRIATTRSIGGASLQMEQALHMIWFLCFLGLSYAAWYGLYRNMCREIDGARSQFDDLVKHDRTQEKIDSAKLRLIGIVGLQRKFTYALLGALFFFIGSALFQILLSHSQGDLRIFGEPRLLTIAMPMVVGFWLGWSAVAVAVSKARTAGRLWML